MKIQDLEKRTGLERPSIRFYEREGLITPERLENGYRDYSEADVEQLMRIKLLRQLGISVEKIRRVQQGSAVFSETITDQVRVLSGQIDEHKRARVVCQAIHDDGAEFKTLDADHYLKLMREIKINDRALGRTNFQENIPKEIHPWRRWFARMLDYALFTTVIRFLIIVVFRVRPLPGEFMNAMIVVLSGLLFVPVEAFLLSKWGATPGKMAMGIRLEYIQGSDLPYSAALRRSWCVYQFGMGFSIPLIDYAMNVTRYCQLTGRTMRRFARYDEIRGPEEMGWDEETEFIYTNWTGKRGAVLAVLIVLQLLIGGCTGLDAIKPKYRGSELTIAQFAENYNSYLEIVNEDVAVFEKLQSSGKKYPVPENVFVVDLNGANEPQEFIYDTEDGIIRSVGLENSWQDVFYLDGESVGITVSLLLAQEGCGILELMEFLDIWSSHADDVQVEFTYRNQEVSWEIQSDNCVVSDGTFFTEDQEETSSVDFSFRVTIHEN